MIEADSRCSDQFDTATLEQFARTFVDASYNESIEGVNSFELRYFISAIGSATPFRYGTVLSATIFILYAFCRAKIEIICGIDW